jgi:hypothetical protein
MNERIRELELEAIAYADSKVPVNNRYNDIYHSIVRGKFAELIVNQCVQLALDEKQRYRNISHRDMLECAVAMDNYQLLLKEHFGVKL